MQLFKILFRASIVALPAVVFALLAHGMMEEGKVPVTTSSKEALAAFLEGRRLAENLRLTDAIAHFQKAVEKDARFAMAHYYLAQTAPTAQQFFSQVNQAVALSSNVSEGEKLMILAQEAGSQGDPMKQRSVLTKLVQKYPGDERAHMQLGINYFGQQEYEKAAEHLKKATDIAPSFAPAYNQLGYAYRFLNNYSDAEKTFKKYTELIPDDPNPYDSYAELLLKIGRFDEAIVQYRKALSLNPNFTNSYAGIAASLMYQGKHAEARAELQKAYAIARTDAERRVVLFTTTVTYLDEGNTAAALKEVEKQYALGEKINDAAAMAGDLGLMATIVLEAGRYDEALAGFEKSVKVILKSDLSQAVKDNAALFHRYNVARVAVAKGDMKTAEKETQKFREAAEAKKNQNQIRLAHELEGMIALEQKDYQKAISALQLASQQNPYNLYRLALAYRAIGEKQKAKEYSTSAAKFYGLPFPNYAFVRTKAGTMLSAR